MTTEFTDLSTFEFDIALPENATSPNAFLPALDGGQDAVNVPLAIAQGDGEGETIDDQIEDAKDSAAEKITDSFAGLVDSDRQIQ